MIENPESIEQVDDCEFADYLRSICEDRVLDKVTLHAFMGTEEEREELELPPLDAPDEAAHGSSVLEDFPLADSEADLLESMPLPGYPEHEKERRAKWL